MRRLLMFCAAVRAAEKPTTDAPKFDFNAFCLPKADFCRLNAHNIEGSCDVFLNPSKATASGGFGQVYPAVFTKRKVFLKKVAFDHEDKPGETPASVSAIIRRRARIREVVMREAEVNFLLDGTPGLALAKACVQTPDYVAFVINDKGKDAHELRAEIKRMPFSGILRVAYKLGQSICNLNGQGVVHGDLKPKNVVIDFSRPKPQVWVIDFGGSCYLNKPCGTTYTHGYVAPERTIARAEDKVSVGQFAFDAYSFAVTVAEMYDPQLLEHIKPHLPKSCKKVVTATCHELFLHYFRGRVAAFPRELNAIVTSGVVFDPAQRATVYQMATRLGVLYDEEKKREAVIGSAKLGNPVLVPIPLLVHPPARPAPVPAPKPFVPLPRPFQPAPQPFVPLPRPFQHAPLPRPLQRVAVPGRLFPPPMAFLKPMQV